jgi:putative antitoxin of VapBC-like toxin-antitoxin system
MLGCLYAGETGMAMTKRSVALEEEVVEEAVALAGKRGFSRLVNEALKLYLQRQRIEAFEEELAKKYGPISPEVKAWGEKIEWPQ